MPTELTNFPRESTLREAVNALNTIAVAQASNVGQFASWGIVQQLVRQGLGAKAFPVGTRLAVSHTQYTSVLLDVIAHDHHHDPTGRMVHSMSMLMRHVIYGRHADNTEALFACAEALSAGIYHFSLPAGYDVAYGGGQTLQFTLATEVPAGGVVMFPWGYNKQVTETKITTYASQTATTALETVSVTVGSGGTDLGIADGTGENMNHIQRARYGSNNWAEGSDRQWLNSVAEANGWWTPKTKFDRPPTYANQPGFMNGFDPEFLAVLGAVDNVTARNTVYEEGGTTGGSYTTRDVFFPLSMTEMGYGNNNGIAEGSVVSFYRGAADVDRIKFDITAQNTARGWWLRSPNPSHAYHVRVVDTSGTLNSGGYALNGYGLAAACVIY